MNKYDEDYQKIRKFYKSDKWHKAREVVIARANGLCEICGNVGVEVHHKIHLTCKNISNPKISIDPNNLILLCTKCHNKEHKRFTSKTEYKFDNNGNLIKK